MYAKTWYVHITYADDLPHEPKDEMLSAFIEVVRPDVDNIAANRLRRSNGERQVLVALIDTEIGAWLARLVDRLLVNCVFLREVYQLATKHTALQNIL